MKETIQKGILGMAAPTAGYAASLSTAEAWLRVASLAVGIAVGCASLISIWLTIQRKRRLNRQEEESDR